MKKLKLILVALLSLLLLASCGGKKSSGEVTVDPSALAKQLAEETVTSDTLSEISTDIMASTYFVDTAKIEASSAYMSTGASACEAAVIKCSNTDYVSEVSDLARDLANTVFPVPGRSSRSTCPPESSAVRILSMTSSFPIITFFIFSLIRSMFSLMGLQSAALRLLYSHIPV